MKKLSSCLAATFLALASLVSQASEQGNLGPEPTVDVVWVGVFVAMFVGLCVWFLVAMIRHERKTKAAQDNAS